MSEALAPYGPIHSGSAITQLASRVAAFGRGATRKFLVNADDDPDWRLMDQLCIRFPAFQFALLDNDGEIASVVHSIPLHWNEDLLALRINGFSWALAKGYRDAEQELPPNAVCFLMIGVRPDLRRHGLSLAMLQAAHAQLCRLRPRHVLVPLRPTHKALYPQFAMADYVDWKTADNEIFDPWLRLHVRYGGKLICVCKTSTVMEASVAEWERRTGLQMPVSGNYVVPDMLSMLVVDCEADIGIYTEANVWISHSTG